MSAPSLLVTPVAVVDPRGQRFAAALTASVLALVLVTGSAWLLAFQVVVFGVGGFVGPQRTPYAVAFRRLIRPRLAPLAELEDATPPRFAQLCGFGFSLVGVAGYLTGLVVLGEIAVAFALAAAFLNAAVGFCVGCELYLLAKRTLS